MAPKESSGAAGRSRPRGSKNRRSAASAAEPESSNPFASSDTESQVSTPQEQDSTAADRQQESPEPEKTIPAALLTRMLHDFFGKEATRISRDANEAVRKYVDVFVREAIARAAVEKRGGFLEVSLVPLR